MVYNTYMTLHISKDRVDNIPTKRIPGPIRETACDTSSFKAVIYAPDGDFINITDVVCNRHKCQKPECNLADPVAV